MPMFFQARVDAVHGFENVSIAVDPDHLRGLQVYRPGLH